MMLALSFKLLSGYILAREKCNDFFKTAANEYKNLVSALRFGRVPKDIISTGSQSCGEYLFGPGQIVEARRHLYLYPIKKGIRRRLKKYTSPFPKNPAVYRLNQAWGKRSNGGARTRRKRLGVSWSNRTPPPIFMSAKELVVKPIERAGACAFVKRYHYSGKVVPNSQLHLGVFWRDKLEGVMQFGPSMRKDLMQPLVTGTAWNGFLELNRMVFSDVLPRNSESRALSVALRLLRAHYRHIDWVVTFSDGCQCGDGTIYRASGFVLTGLKRNTEIKINPGNRDADGDYGRLSFGARKRYCIMDGFGRLHDAVHVFFEKRCARPSNRAGAAI